MLDRATSVRMWQVYMHGKCQTQWDDHLYYIAIRQIKAFGFAVSPASLHRFHRYMHSSPQLCLPGGSNCPASFLHSIPRQAAYADMTHGACAVQTPSGTLFSGRGLASVVKGDCAKSPNQIQTEKIGSESGIASVRSDAGSWFKATMPK